MKNNINYLSVNFAGDTCIACKYKKTILKEANLAGFVAERTKVPYTLGKTRYCPECGIAYCNVRFTDEQLGMLYHNYRDGVYDKQRESHEPGYIQKYSGCFKHPRPYVNDIDNLLLSFKPNPKRVLDIGGNDGMNSPLKNIADELVIYDLGSPLPKGLFDVISMEGVLEHVSYPKEMIEFAKTYLAADGIIYAEIPKGETITPWWHEHINIFTEKSLRCLFSDILYFDTTQTISPDSFLIIAKS